MMDERLVLIALVVVSLVATSGCFNLTGVVRDKANVSGSALSEGNITYAIEVAESWNPTNWSTLGVSIENISRKVNESILGLVDTTYFMDGNYSIRLTVTDEFNQSSRDVVFVTVDNVEITYPENDDIIAKGRTIEVNGSVLGHFERYYLEYGYGFSPQNFSTEGITLTGGGTSEVNNGVIGFWNTSNITALGQYTLRLVLEYIGNRTYSEEVSLTIDVFAEGWPQKVNSSFWTPPLFADLNADGIVDVLAVSSDGIVYAWNSTGNILPGWPVNLEVYTDHPAVGDLNGDGIPEVIICGGNGVHALSSNGSNLSGWPVNLNESPTTAPILYDLDGDLNLEVLFGAQNMMYALNSTGSTLQGFPVHVSNETYESLVSLSVGDINGDDKPEIVASLNYEYYIYVYNASGSAIEGWPKTPANTSYLSDILLADFNSDNILDILAGTSSGEIALLYGNSSLFLGFPKNIGVVYEYVYPIASDLNADGNPEIVVSTWYDGSLYALTSNGSNFGDKINGTVIDYSLESTHPYTDGFDYTWNLTVPNASSLSAHLERIDVENGFDFIYIMNSSGHTIENFTGSQEDVWTKSANGESIRIRLVSDNTVSSWGFRVDKILNGTIEKPWPIPIGTETSYPIAGEVDGLSGPEVLVSYANETYYLLSAFQANGSLVNGWPKRMRETIMFSPTLGELNPSNTNIGATASDRIYVWMQNTSYDISSAQWESINHDLHNTRAYINPAERVRLLSPLRGAVVNNGSVSFEFVPNDVELTSCSFYSNASGVWSEGFLIGRVLSQRPNNLSLNFPEEKTIAWNITCRNYNGLNVSAKTNGLFHIVSNNLSANASFLNVTNESAIISFSTNYPTSYTLGYGTSNAFGAVYTSNETELTHGVMLTNLSPFTTYHVNITVYDAYGRNTTSRLNFTTALYAISRLNLSANASVEVNISESELNLSLNFKSNESKENVTLLVNASNSNPTNASLALPALGKFLDLSIPEAGESLEWIYLKIDYTHEEVLAANIREETLSYFYFNSSGEWQRLNASTMNWVYGEGVNNASNFVWANVSHLSKYAIAGENLEITIQTDLITGWNMISLPLTI